MEIESISSQIKVDPLGKRHLGSVVDGASGPAHVLLPTVRTRLPASSCVLLASEGPTNLSTRRTDVHIDDSAVRSMRTHPTEGVAHVLGEETAAETLRDTVVNGDGLFESGVFLDEEDGAEVLFLQEGGALGGLDDSWLHEVSTSVQPLATIEDLSAFLLDPFQGRVVDLHGSCVVERSAESVRVQGVANFD